jgi:hypothetical protein
MTARRKREITGLSNERDFPRLIELALPPKGLRAIFLDIDTFHRHNRIPARRGRSQHDIGQPRIRFCFPDAAIADAFRDRFGGVRMTYAPEKSKSRTSTPTTADHRRIRGNERGR